MVAVVADGCVVGVVGGNLTPLRPQITDARLPLIGQPGIRIRILEKFLRVVGSGNALTLELDFCRGLLLLSLEEVVDLGPCIGGYREIRILIHRVEESVRLLIPNVVAGEKVLRHVGIAQNIDP